LTKSALEELLRRGKFGRLSYRMKTGNATDLAHEFARIFANRFVAVRADQWFTSFADSGLRAADKNTRRSEESQRT
jgi:hypothetical protein